VPLKARAALFCAGGDDGGRTVEPSEIRGLDGVFGLEPLPLDFIAREVVRAELDLAALPIEKFRERFLLAAATVGEEELFVLDVGTSPKIALE
jgi:hypothetical protein